METELMGRSPVARWQGGKVARARAQVRKAVMKWPNHEHNRDSFEYKSRGEKFSLSSVHLQTHNWIKVCISTSC